MTIEFGVARDEIFTLVNDLLLRGFASKYPEINDEKIFWDDGAADFPVPAKPYISCRLLVPNSPEKAKDFRTFPNSETWIIDVTDSSDGAYNIQVQGIDFGLGSTGLNPTQLRDALLAVVTIDTASTATAVGSTQIQLVAVNAGERLFVETSPATLISTNVIADQFERQHNVVECQLQIGCWGRMDPLDPRPSQSGRAIAEFVQSLMLSRQMTYRLRDRGHVPVRVSLLDGGGLENQQANSEAIVQVVLATDARLDTQVASSTAVAVTNLSPQITP